MRSPSRSTPWSPMNAVTGISGMFLGIIVGYVMGAAQIQPGTSLLATSAAPLDPDHVHSAPATAVANEHELAAYRDILASDPGNLKAHIELGNRLYDAGRFAEAIPYYQQALALDAKNVDVSTDLGTSLYYTGRVDEALAQMEKSLAIDPAHGQTLFNIGIITRDGKKDSKGAVQAWERLLEVSPNYPDAARVRDMITQAR